MKKSLQFIQTLCLVIITIAVVGIWHQAISGSSNSNQTRPAMFVSHKAEAVEIVEPMARFGNMDALPVVILNTDDIRRK